VSAIKLGARLCRHRDDDVTAELRATGLQTRHGGGWTMTISAAPAHVAVIIPAYRATYLGEALESVFFQ
jgi:hypothetical protein